ncbi:hypothetical protein BDV30DRAFT_3344 [Aspergillus minisclerotigenes]|uniref:Uncharacterized protein n=1 Tax=Aspergillus minisclerotigenes TaxID=656917 RepID=A0A5N6JP44_9EURO|nr:hypothetical protein BDV30DRAFT_3344 [Aspergillus minisclerotigenes]
MDGGLDRLHPLLYRPGSLCGRMFLCLFEAFSSYFLLIRAIILLGGWNLAGVLCLSFLLSLSLYQVFVIGWGGLNDIGQEHEVCFMN